jgi:hypothetical protein
MPKRFVDLREQRPLLLDIVSYGRGGRRFSPRQRQQLLLTVHGVPEVMVKVTGGARTLAGVERHMKYIGRDGELGLETDMGTQAAEKQFERDLVEDWDLDLEALKRRSEKSIRGGRPPKLVHNLMFSMPAGTPPKKVLQAVRKLALNEWHLSHRYTMALHTDTPHPHVHVVLKAVSEKGVRLNIRKATLRSWRAQFAENLRELGVPANATERAVRGQTRKPKSDGAFRASARGDSRVGTNRKRTDATKAAAGRDSLRGTPAEQLRTRLEIIEGWDRAAAHAQSFGDTYLTERIRVFADRLKSKLAASRPWRDGLHNESRPRSPSSHHPPER